KEAPKLATSAASATTKTIVSPRSGPSAVATRRRRFERRAAAGRAGPTAEASVSQPVSASSEGAEREGFASRGAVTKVKGLSPSGSVNVVEREMAVLSGDLAFRDRGSREVILRGRRADARAQCVTDGARRFSNSEGGRQPRARGRSRLATGLHKFEAGTADCGAVARGGIHAHLVRSRRRDARFRMSGSGQPGRSQRHALRRR